MQPLYNVNHEVAGVSSWPPAESFMGALDFGVTEDRNEETMDSCAINALSMLVGAPFAATMADYLLKILNFTSSDTLL